jgi:DNA-binding ferritin-like protein (Dps family)
MTTGQSEPKRGYLRYVEMVTGSLDQKRSYRQYKARVARLPANYRTAVEALNRYLTYFGGISKGDVLVSMLNDLADLFEQSAADATPIRAIVGENPVEFVETFLQNYAEGQWINKERRRLIDAIDRASGEDTEEGSSR